MKICRWCLAVSFLFLFTGLKTDPPQEAKKPLNVILLIGDGMGLSQLSTAYYYGKSSPNFSRFPVVGFITTSSCSDKITDSAAGATAFSTGKKTRNQRVGYGHDGKRNENLISYFARKGKSTGLAVTSSITHATPAAFYAYQNNRFKENEIARQLADSELTYFAGGGGRYFDFSDRDELKARGFSLFTDSLQPFEGVKDVTRLGFFMDEGSLPRMDEGRGNYLRNASNLAMQYLSQNEKGFFLMIEGSQIDWAGHANNSNVLIAEVLDFDEVVGAALDFAEKDGNTLVIVTADHETGGYTLAPGEKEVPFQGKQPDYNSINPKFSTGGHTAALVPVLAYGPGAEEFSGIYPNIRIHEKIKKLTD